MGKRLAGVSLVVAAAWSMASCQMDAKKASAPAPESEQVISNNLKDLYMVVSAAAPQSPEQQRTILRMAERAANGKELLLVMRAAEGVFPAAADSPAKNTERQLHAMVTAKMMRAATLDQMVDYAKQYTVDEESTRPYVQRMFELGEGNSDSRAWYRIRATASRLHVRDMEQQAQARAEQLASR
ncbi:MAG: hypothetical protein JST11_12130 [Acidobacteria bacterium]|nr:hypothetical protein [Acidobacteriota bacterium]